MKTPKQILLDEYYNVAGKLFGDFFIRTRADSEQKKSIEAMDFLQSLMSGNIKEEWKLEETEEYKQLQILVKAINLLN